MNYGYDWKNKGAGVLPAIKSFSKEQENVNTKKKTLFDLKLFNKFFTSGDERREL